MFQVLSADLVGLDEIENPRLRRLLDCWTELAAQDAVPRIGSLDPRRLGDNLGRTHLVQVMGREKFRFLLYGSNVTNPDGRSMAGRTTDDYIDRVFAQLIIDNYQEAVDRRLPVCRHVRASRGDAPYEYTRLTLPFSSDGQTINLLLVGTQRVTVPDDLVRDRVDDGKRYVTELLSETTRCLQLMREGHDKALAASVRQFGTALLWNIAEMKAGKSSPRA